MATAPTQTQQSLPIAEFPYWEVREKICQSQDCSDGDTCKPTEETHPGRSSIKRGTMRKELSCPLGHWKAIPSQCPQCKRRYGIVSTGLCAWCQNEKDVAIANANIRAKQKRPVPPSPRFKRRPVESVTQQERQHATWSVAVTTAPRQNCTLDRCLQSIRDAGWTDSQTATFAEPGSSRARFGYTIANTERRGAWHNWLASCRHAIREGTDFVMTVQDDSLFHPDSRELIESITWPENAAFVSLYTPSHYSFDSNRYIWHPIGVRHVYTRSLWGACALVWRPETLQRIIDHPIAMSWLGASRRTVASKRKYPEQIANVDTAIGQIANDLGLDMYFVDPSPVTHIATHSTLKHGGNKGKRNAIRPAERTLPLLQQVFP